MQVRNKWQKSQPNFAIGDTVILKNELTPPATWPLGLIAAVHPGKDGLIRAVTVKTASSSFVRPIVKLIKLSQSVEGETQDTFSSKVDKEVPTDN